MVRRSDTGKKVRITYLVPLRYGYEYQDVRAPPRLQRRLDPLRAHEGASAGALLEFGGPFGSDRMALPCVHRGIPMGRRHWRMRRYELMLVLRPDLPDDKVQATLERTTRAIAAGGGQIVKQAPWGRRRLAYPIDHHREGSYYVILFESPATAISELERGLQISEEVLRHLITRVERPVRAARGHDAEADADVDLPSADEEPEEDQELIDESETEAAPAAID
jgi:small subunit ribosomal protein S6